MGLLVCSDFPKCNQIVLIKFGLASTLLLSWRDTTFKSKWKTGVFSCKCDRTIKMIKILKILKKVTTDFVLHGKKDDVGVKKDSWSIERKQFQFWVLFKNIFWRKNFFFVPSNSALKHFLLTFYHKRWERQLLTFNCWFFTSF